MRDCGCDGNHVVGQGECGAECKCMNQIPCPARIRENMGGDNVPDHKRGNPGIGDLPPKQKLSSNLVVIDGDYVIGLA